ncbi:histidine phosphatase family protein, partial [Vibrio alginolyticus]
MDIVFVRHGVPDFTLADERQMTQLEKDYAPLCR